MINIKKWLKFHIKNCISKNKSKKKYGRLFPIHDTIEKSDSDYYIISYPKSGRTWIRFMLGNYISKLYKIKTENLLDLYELTSISKLSKISMSHSGTGESAYMSSIKEIENSISFFSNKNIILLTRDPRDTVVSFFHQNTSRKKIYWSNISDFIRSYKFGIKKIILFNKLFVKHKSKYKSFKEIKYEDFKENTKSNFVNLLIHLKIPINNKIVEDIIKMSNFSVMQKNESQNKYKYSQLKKRGSNKNSLKVRKGKVGSYRDELSKSDIDFVDKQYKSMSK